MVDDNVLIIAIGIVFQIPDYERFKRLGHEQALIAIGSRPIRT